MDAKFLLLGAAERAANSFFHQAHRVPADKLLWRPLDEGRSVLDQAAEVAASPMWVVGLLEARGFNQRLMAEGQKHLEEAKSSLKTVEDCEKFFWTNFEAMRQAVAAFPDSELQATTELPWGPDKNWSFAEVIGIVAWNATYHMGQVCYLQTLYGDKEMM